MTACPHCNGTGRIPTTPPLRGGLLCVCGNGKPRMYRPGNVPSATALQDMLRAQGKIS